MKFSFVFLHIFNKILNVKIPWWSKCTTLHLATMTPGGGGGGGDDDNHDGDDDHTLYQSNLNCLFLPDQAVTRYVTLNIT